MNEYVGGLCRSLAEALGNYQTSTCQGSSATIAKLLELIEEHEPQPSLIVVSAPARCRGRALPAALPLPCWLRRLGTARLLLASPGVVTG